MRASLAAGDGTSGELLLWDSLGLPNDALTTLRDRYSLHLSATRNFAGVELSLDQAGPFGAAAGLASLAIRGETLPLDFLHSALIPPKHHRIGRKVIWGIGVGAAVVVGIVAMAWSLHTRQLELNDLTGQISQMQPAVTSARAMDAKVTTADDWYANRPSILNCMEHITQAFPQEGLIWATNISLRDNGIGSITGKARDQIQPLAVFDRMKNDPKFGKVTVDYIRQGTGTNSREITFSISFIFKL